MLSKGSGNGNKADQIFLIILSEEIPSLMHLGEMPSIKELVLGMIESVKEIAEELLNSGISF